MFHAMLGIFLNKMFVLKNFLSTFCVVLKNSPRGSRKICGEASFSCNMFSQSNQPPIQSLGELCIGLEAPGISIMLQKQYTSSILFVKNVHFRFKNFETVFACYIFTLDSECSTYVFKRNGRPKNTFFKNMSKQ